MELVVRKRQKVNPALCTFNNYG
uniref:Uncharacterized protein n=1 Tax=Anguilla anguilla TaxID=7936 RepID=A0A0E9VK33_ANGAN